MDKMMENPDLVDVDVVKVYVRNVKTEESVSMMKWYYLLAEALSLNFSVKYFYNRKRCSDFSFYGLKSNSLMAAYMYKFGLNQIHLLSKTYKPGR